MNWRKFPFTMIVTFLFFAVGIYTNQWDKIWILFLTIPIYYGIVAALRADQKNQTHEQHENNKWSDF